MESLTDFEDRTDFYRLGLALMALLLLWSAGCAPKRVLRTETVVAAPVKSAATTSASDISVKSEFFSHYLG